MPQSLWQLYVHRAGIFPPFEGLRLMAVLLTYRFLGAHGAQEPRNSLSVTRLGKKTTSTGLWLRTIRCSEYYGAWRMPKRRFGFTLTPD